MHKGIITTQVSEWIHKTTTTSAVGCKKQVTYLLPVGAKKRYSYSEKNVAAS